MAQKNISPSAKPSRLLASEIVASIDEALARGNDNAAIAEQLSRIRTSAEVVLRRAAWLSDPPVGQSPGMSDLLRHIYLELRTFIESGQIGHLVTASEHNEKLINALHLNALLQDSQTITRLALDVEELKGMSLPNAQATRRLQEDVAQTLEALQERARQVMVEGEKQRSRIDALISQIQGQYLQEETGRRSKSDAAEAERSARFESARASERDEVDAWLADQSDAIAHVVGDGKEAVAALLSGAESEANQVITRLGEVRKEAEELVGAIALKGMAGGYQKVANREMAAARVWQVLTVLSMLGLVAVAGLTAVRLTTQDDFHWGPFGVRVFLALAIGILSAYSAKQASEHLAAERANRRMELELGALDPYLAALPDAERHRVKGELVARLFAQPTTPTVPADGLQTHGTAADVIRLLTELLAKK